MRLCQTNRHQAGHRARVMTIILPADFLPLSNRVSAMLLCSCEVVRQGDTRVPRSECPERCPPTRSGLSILRLIILEIMPTDRKIRDASAQQFS